MTIRSFARTRSWVFLMPLFLLAQAVFRDSYGWLWFTLPVVCIFLLVPQRGARLVVPFLALVIGVMDFLGVRAFLDHRFPAPYGKVAAAGRVPWTGSLLMPAAVAFLAVGVWLYFRLDVPGASWLAGSAVRYRARAGAFFWPALALIPVQVLGWKLFQGVTGWGGASRTAQLKLRVETLTQTRADAVDTAAAELRRIERDLHDGAQARLVALGMNLRVAERVLRTDPDAALNLVSEARDTSSRALTELRGLVRGIYPPVLADRGLVDAIRALALDTPLPAVVDGGLPGRPDLPVASAVYFSVAEALANVAKHAGAGSAWIHIGYERGVLRAQVTDDGAGGADPAQGSGLHGVERRLAAFDGILAVTSPAGGPTIIVIEVPCALS
jgi:signal transduction histidine kinase